jgi:hypothetical protein
MVRGLSVLSGVRLLVGSSIYGKTSWAVCALRLVSRFLFRCPAVYAASAVVTFAPLWQRDSPASCSVASGTVPLNALFIPASGSSPS